MNMRPVIMIFMVLALAGSALAQDLGPSRNPPVKEAAPQVYHPPKEPRQGGDTVNDAFPIFGLPFTVTGTTTGYINNYDWECPYDSMSPDVVYSYTPASDIRITVDLCGSPYDTKTFIYDADLVVIACNDDFYFDEVCGIYVSKIEEAFLAGGAIYYIVIDGYGGDHGEYLLNITEFVPCFVTCPVDAVLEGEPTLQDGYEDVYNSGCSSPEPGSPFQAIDWVNVEGGHPGDGTAWLCGKSGWFFSSDGGEIRDTDWFRVFAREDGQMECTLESEHSCYIFKLAPLDCSEVGVELQALADCEQPATLTFPVTAGEEIWLWVGPSTFSGPVTEFPYFMTVSNNLYDVVPAEQAGWGEVKSMYR
jgi:hypothetical protein